MLNIIKWQVYENRENIIADEVADEVTNEVANEVTNEVADEVLNIRRNVLNVPIVWMDRKSHPKTNVLF